MTSCTQDLPSIVMSSLKIPVSGRVIFRLICLTVLFSSCQRFLVSGDKGPSIIVLGGGSGGASQGTSGTSPTLLGLGSQSSSSMPNFINAGGGGNSGSPNILVLGGDGGGKRNDKKSNVIIIMQPQQQQSPSSPSSFHHHSPPLHHHSMPNVMHYPSHDFFSHQMPHHHPSPTSSFSRRFGSSYPPFLPSFDENLFKILNFPGFQSQTGFKGMPVPAGHSGMSHPRASSEMKQWMSSMDGSLSFPASPSSDSVASSSDMSDYMTPSYSY